jgi:hypothetical protein
MRSMPFAKPHPKAAEDCRTRRLGGTTAGQANPDGMPTAFEPREASWSAAPRRRFPCHDLIYEAFPL